MRHPFLASETSGSASQKRIVMSCPELGSLDDGPPYDEKVMDKVSELQQLGFVKLGFDRAGTSTARQKDVAKFDKADALRSEGKLKEAKELLRATDWWYGYQTSVKQAAKLESQGFDGVLQVTCIRGGFITQLEAEHMEQIMSEAKSDAFRSGIDCRYTVSEVSYCEFLSEYEDMSGGALQPPTRAQVEPQREPEPEQETASHGGLAIGDDGATTTKDDVIAQKDAQLQANRVELAEKNEELLANRAELEALRARLGMPKEEGIPPSSASSSSEER